MGDAHARGQAGPQLRPARVLLDPDAHGHALHDAGELARDDVPRHQRELGAGGFVDPDDATLEGAGDGVHVDPNRIPRRHAGQPVLLQVGGDIKQIGIVHAQHGHAGGGEVAQVAIALDHHAGERGENHRVLQLVLGRLERRLPDVPLSLGFADLGVAGLGQVHTLVRLLLGGEGGLHVALGDVVLAAFGLRQGKFGVGEVDLGVRVVAGPLRLLRPLLGGGVVLEEVRVALVLDLGERLVGLGGGQRGPGLVDALVHLILGEQSHLLRLGVLGLGGGQRPPGDLDLYGHFLLEAVELRLRRLQLGAGDMDLVLVTGRIDLGQQVALLHRVVFFDQVAGDVPGRHLRGDVDDVPFDEGVVGLGRGETVGDPQEEEEADDKGQGQQCGRQEEAEEEGPWRPGGRGRRRRGARFGHGSALLVSRRGADCLGRCSPLPQGERGATVQYYGPVPQPAPSARMESGVGLVPIAYSRRASAVK